MRRIRRSFKAHGQTRLVSGEKQTNGISYTVIYSRRRSMGISVHTDRRVIARVPIGTSDKTVEEMIRGKAEWIKKALNHYETLTRIDPDESLKDGDRLFFMGKENLLRVIPSDRYYIRRSDHTIEVGIRVENNPLIINAMLEHWYGTVAKPFLTKQFHETLDNYRKYNFSPTGFAVRKMKKRWGSCTSKGRIAISYDLIKLDPVFAEYVILHELCHLRHHNHGQGFYKLLSEVYPDWKAVRAELKKIIR
ncbi:MAG: M48 family metallopeptidase [Bacteroidales bacterium]|nr:M48 family metallopeptidase [Bacteroidales bacterium]